jgi:F-type H+-transporting ATPase subunit delta
MTTISNNDIARAIYLASKEKEDEQFFLKVTQFLARKRFLSRYPDILELLSQIINKERGVIIVKVSSKHNLHEKIKKELVEILSKHYPGKIITIVPNLDQTLLGGFKIEIDDEVIDLTVKNKIEKLQEYLTESI